MGEAAPVVAVFSDAWGVVRARASNLETSFWVLGEVASRAARVGLVMALSGLVGAGEGRAEGGEGVWADCLAGESFALAGDLGVADGAIVRAVEVEWWMLLAGDDDDGDGDGYQCRIDLCGDGCVEVI